MRGAGVGTGLVPAFCSTPEADSARGCEGRVATTDCSRTFSGGLTPRLSLGTKLAGVVVTWGAVWIGRMLFSSTWVTRVGLIGPLPN